VDLVEIDVSAPSPRPATARKFRKQIPKSIQVTARARWNGEGDPAWPAALAAAQALDAQVLVVCTTPSFTPVASAADALRAALAPWSKAAAWEPQGVWDEREIARLCKAVGCSHASDPALGPPALNQALVYLRLRGLGPSSRRVTENTLNQMALQALERSAESLVLCVFATAEATRDAKRLQSLLGELAEDSA
jgi:uncharacterized protein YecE (DUF72 family)